MVKTRSEKPVFYSAFLKPVLNVHQFIFSNIFQLPHFGCKITMISVVENRRSPGVALFHQRITMALTIISDASDVSKVIAAVKAKQKISSKWMGENRFFGADGIIIELFRTAHPIRFFSWLICLKRLFSDWNTDQALNFFTAVFWSTHISRVTYHKVILQLCKVGDPFFAVFFGSRDRQNQRRSVACFHLKWILLKTCRSWQFLGV